MTADEEKSVTQWIEDLKAGNRDEASRRLWGRYFTRLARLAQARLRDVRGPADGEDVALSVFDSVFRGVAAGRFPDLGDRDDLWRLLVTITERKAIDLLRREGRAKRGGARVVGEDAPPDGDAEGVLARVAGREPTPEFAALAAEECERLLRLLGDETLRSVAVRKLEGDANEEIARRLGCGLRTVERKLALIRTLWEAEVGR